MTCAEAHQVMSDDYGNALQQSTVRSTLYSVMRFLFEGREPEYFCEFTMRALYGEL